MKTGAQAQVKAPSQPAFTPVQVGLLQRKCVCGGSAGLDDQCNGCQTKNLLGLQTKLAVGESGDVYEQEADRIADQVLATPAHPGVSGAPPRIQRFSGQSNGQMQAVPASVDHALASPGRPLEPTLRQNMEQRFGYDFSHVRVHSGMAAEQSARDVNAHAYTVGHNIVFGAGRFAAESQDGRRLIAHELVHVIQQTGRGVDTIQCKEKKDQHNWTKVTKIIVEAGAVGEGRGRAVTADGEQITIHIEVNKLNVRSFVMSGKLSAEPEWDSWSRIHFDSMTMSTFVFLLPPQVSLAPTYTVVVKPRPRAVREVWKEIQALPKQIQEIVTSKYGRAATVKDYETALRIGKKLQSAGLSADEIYEYTKVAGKSRSFSETGLDAYLSARSARQAERGQNLVERGKAEAGLFGREELYRRYRKLLRATKVEEARARVLGTTREEISASPELIELRDGLNADLVKAGFPRGITDFEKLIDDYEKAFQREARETAMDVLLKYEHLLIRDYDRFVPGRIGETTAAKMLADLGKVREPAQVQYEKASRARSLLKDLEYDISRMSESKAYAARAEAERLRREAAWREREADKMVAGAVPEHTVVGWQDFPREKLLSRATPGDVRHEIAWYIAVHEAQIQRARKMLIEKPSRIYELDNLLAVVYEAQDIKKDSLYDLIIRDRISQIESDKTAKEILWAIIAIALTVVTFGGGTPALLATVALLGIGAAQAWSAVQDYDEKTTFYMAQLLRTEPPAAWAIIAVISVGLDATGVVQALKAVVPAAKAFNTSGDLVELGKALAPVDARVSESVMNAAKQVRAAEQQFKKAASEFKAVFTGGSGKAKAVVPSLTVMAAQVGGEAAVKLLAMTHYYIKSRRLKSFNAFIKQLERDGLIEWARLAPQEQNAIRQAFQEALESGRTGQLPYGRQLQGRLSERARTTFTPETVDQFAAQGKALGKSDEEIIGALESELQSQRLVADAAAPHLSPDVPVPSNTIPQGGSPKPPVHADVPESPRVTPPTPETPVAPSIADAQPTSPEEAFASLKQELKDVPEATGPVTGQKLGSVTPGQAPLAPARPRRTFSPMERRASGQLEKKMAAEKKKAVLDDMKQRAPDVYKDVVKRDVRLQSGERLEDFAVSNPDRIEAFHANWTEGIKKGSIKKETTFAAYVRRRVSGDRGLAGELEDAFVRSGDEILVKAPKSKSNLRGTDSMSYNVSDDRIKYLDNKSVTTDATVGKVSALEKNLPQNMADDIIDLERAIRLPDVPQEIERIVLPRLKAARAELEEYIRKRGLRPQDLYSPEVRDAFDSILRNNGIDRVVTFGGSGLGARVSTPLSDVAGFKAERL